MKVVNCRPVIFGLRQDNVERKMAYLEGMGMARRAPGTRRLPGGRFMWAAQFLVGVEDPCPTGMVQT